VEDVELLDKRGYLTVCLAMGGREGRVLLRKPEGIREWHRTIKVSETREERKNGQSLRWRFRNAWPTAARGEA